jgi:hypothetical protein
LLHLLNHTFSAKVWNVLVHPIDPVLFIETRDDTSAQVRYSAYDILNNNFLLQEIAIIDDWWCSLVAVSDEVLLLHLFTDGRNPDPSALLAYNFKEQKELWRSENSRFEACKDTEVQIWKEGALQLIDLKTGNVIESPLHLYNNAQTVVYPVVYHAGTQYHSTLAAFIKSRKGHEAAGHIEYLELQEKIIMSYYFRSDKGLANFLLMLDKNGEELLYETLGLNFVALGWNSFFVCYQSLVFVKNKTELNIYKFL